MKHLGSVPLKSIMELFTLTGNFFIAMDLGDTKIMKYLLEYIVISFIFALKVFRFTVEVLVA